MASSWPKFQIPSVASLKEHRCQQPFLKGPSSVKSDLKENVRSFWSRRSKDQPVRPGPGNCGQPLPIRMDLVSKCCPPKSLKSTAKKCEKRDGTKKSKAKSEDDKLTWWEKIFGPSPKRLWPDPCSCRVAHRQRKNIRAQDPRLLDPRYKITAGDVFLYTEPIKLNKRCNFEPQPKAPPDFVVPRAALIKMLSRLCDSPSVSHIGLIYESPDCKKRAQLMPYRIPYEEMRPPQMRRKPFNCYEGVSPEDVLLPINRDRNLYQSFQKQSHDQCDLIKKFENIQMGQTEVCEDEVDSNETIQKCSRIEQLKVLVKQKDTSQCIRSFL